MKQTRGGYRMIRKEQVMRDPVADSYHPTQKLPDATRCPDCGAFFNSGRWSWTATAEVAHEHRCPACQRVHDRYPAGYVTLHGPLTDAESEQISSLARHCEAAERDEHPLERIMAIDRGHGELVITTTGTHVARRIAEAVNASVKGKLTFRWSDGENLLRVDWRR